MFLWPRYWTDCIQMICCILHQGFCFFVWFKDHVMWRCHHLFYYGKYLMVTSGDLTTPHWTTISWVCTRTENETCCVVTLLKRTASLQLLGRLFEAAEALQGPRAGINVVNHIERTLISCMTEYITFVCNYTISPSQGCMLLCEQEALAHYFP